MAVPSTKYLLELEEVIYRPPTNYTLEKGHPTSRTRYYLFSLLYEFLASQKDAPPFIYVFGLGATLSDIFFSLTNDLGKNYGLKDYESVVYSVLLWLVYFYLDYYGNIFENDIMDVQSYIMKVLDGQIIRPSQIFYGDIMKGNQITSLLNKLILITYFIPELMTYKPSDIANACKFIITGEETGVNGFKYTGNICNIIVNNFPSTINDGSNIYLLLSSTRRELKGNCLGIQIVKEQYIHPLTRIYKFHQR